MKKAVIYARYSSDKQTEQSIEGQLYDCYNYAKENDIAIVHEYIDRAMTGRNDDRPQFQKMIKDSELKNWEFVLVWKLDRFARNTIDSAIYRQKLMKNGVRIISAKECFGDDPGGQMMERVIEAINEYYSADLREKTIRGMRQSAMKCNSTGGHIPIGYKIENKKLVIDEATREIPETVFKLYSEGERLSDIAELLNSKGYRTRKGNKFTTNSFYSMLSNEKYIGVYHYNDDIRIEGGCPKMIDEGVFELVQKKLSANRKRAAKNSARADYILSGKVFCGHCGEPMSGLSGTSRNGGKHYYYRCSGVQKKTGCKKKIEVKDSLEREVCKYAREAFVGMDMERFYDDVLLKFHEKLKLEMNVEALETELKSVISKAEKVVDAIAEMGGSQMLTDKLKNLEEQREALESELRTAQHVADNIPTRDDVKRLADMVLSADTESEEARKWLIDIMIKKIFIYDDKVKIVFNNDDPDREVNWNDIEDDSSADSVCTLSAMGSHRKNLVNKPFARFFTA